MAPVLVSTTSNDSAVFRDPVTGQVETVSGHSDLHRSKHQINQVAALALENEREMQRRSVAGMLTKKQTWGKYGW